MTREEFSTNGRTGLLYRATHSSTHRILFLHGAGEFGHGPAALFKHPGLPTLLRDGLELEHDVIIPCGPATGTWDPEWLDVFLQTADAQFPQPTETYHLMGYSRGCAGAYHYAAHCPERIASITALAGKKQLDLVPALARIPVLLIHGEQDAQIPFSDSEEMYGALKGAGCDVRFMREEGDHYISGSVFARDEVYLWQRGVVDESSRSGNPANPGSGRASTA